MTARRLAAAVLLLLPLLLTPLHVLGAGLGRLTVQSALGQPLAAEIEIVSLQAGEEESLAARLAPNEAFRQASIEFNPALMGMRFAIERRAGRPILKLTTTAPISEPFLDILVELSWNTGRLVREYTFLLDPPEYRGIQPGAPAPVARPAPPPPVRAVPVPQPRVVEERAIAAPPAPAAAAGAAGTYEVKRGDTLARIAAQTKPPSATLQQMLVALYRANPDAFIGNNINRLRAGRILNVPDQDSTVSVSPEEARRLVATQAQDFRDYQSKLAGTVAAAPAGPATTRRADAGKIAPPPEAPRAGEQKDQLKLSKADPAAKGARSRAARGDDLAARERAMKETESRIADLERNVQDLQKLLELKSQSLAELEKKGGVKPAAPVPAKPQPAAPATVAEAPKPAPAAKAPEAAKPAEAAKAPEVPKPAAEAPKPAAEAPKPAAVAPKPAVEAPKPAAEAPKLAAEAPKPAAEAPKPAGDATKPATDAAKPKPKPAAPPPPPPPPASLIDEFLDNPLALAGLVAVLLLLVGYGAWAWRQKKAQQTKFQDSVMGVPPASSLGASSVFSGAGGQIVDTGASVSPVSVSDVNVAGIDSDEVDPIAEADVYMAYGRDTQAEEILKDALAKDPKRLAVHAKLLEIYAGRRDTQNFEQTAMKVKDLTGGQGADWDKATALGRSIDPASSLYGGDGSVAAGVGSAVVLASASDTAPTLDFDLDAATPAARAPDITLDAGPLDTPAPAVDFDLGVGDAPAAAAQSKGDFNPDATLIIDPTKDRSVPAGLDFDLGMGDTAKPAQPASEQTTPAVPAQSASGGLDFDLNLDMGGDKTPAPAPVAEQPLPEMDMSSISFDLGTPADSTAPGDADPRWQEVATKLDLAKAYEEMGDKDGARDLLGEVVKEGDDAQQKQARQMLAKLG